MKEPILTILEEVKNKYGTEIFSASQARRFHSAFNDFSRNNSDYKVMSRFLREIIAEFDGFTVLCNATHDQVDRALADKICRQKLTDRAVTERALAYLSHIAGYKQYAPTAHEIAEPPKVTPKPAPAPAPVPPAALPASPAEPKTTRGYLCLEESEWSDAKSHFNSALDLDAKYAPAYVGLLCAELKAASEQELQNKDYLLSENTNFKRAVRFADDSLKARLELYNNIIKQRLDEQKRAEEFAQLVNVMDLAVSEKICSSDDFRKLSKQFRGLGNYKNAPDLAAKCEGITREIIKQEELLAEQKRQQYERLLSEKSKATLEQDYYNLIAKFQAMDGYKDTADLAVECERTYLKMEADRKAEEQKRQQYERLLNKKSNATTEYDYYNLIAEFKAIGDYKDAASLAVECEKIYLKKSKEVYPGKIIEFGGYDWRVLDVQNDKALIISEEIIEKRPYNVEYEDVTWERCTLRKYLNNEFYNSKFNSSEQSQISQTPIKNKDNLWYNVNGGNDTNDRVFLLSLEEVDEYFGNSGDYLSKRRKKYDNGKFFSDDDGYCLSNDNDESRMANYGDSASWWWLRSPGFHSGRAAAVNGDGSVDVRGGSVNHDNGVVRPALWLNLQSAIFDTGDCDEW